MKAANMPTRRPTAGIIGRAANAYCPPCFNGSSASALRLVPVEGGESVAVPRRVAERNIGPARALEPEVVVELPREADLAAVPHREIRRVGVELSEPHLLDNRRARR